MSGNVIVGYRTASTTSGIGVDVTPATPLPVGTGGSAAARLPSSANNTNPTVVKASAGSVYSINCTNAAAAVRYLKFYDKATAPTVGTDTPVLTVAIPVGAFSLNLGGFPFATGISYGIVTGAADNNTTAPAAGDILGLNITYT